MQRVIVLAVTTAIIVGRTADAHVAPSVDDNNRYIKLTPAADRVRLAYTVFFGEVPGRQMRPSLDADRDGQLSDEDGQRFGEKLAREVADGLELTIDGATKPIRWTTVAVGFGSPDVGAGSFSVDMVAYVCLAESDRHTLLLKDRFRVPKPGETEIRVEDAPGITIQHARIGVIDDPAHDYKFMGPGGPLMDDGLDLAFSVSATAPRGDQACADAGARADAPTGSHARTIALVVGGCIVLGGLVLLFVRRRT